MPNSSSTSISRLAQSLTATPGIPYIQRRKGVVITVSPSGADVILGDSGVVIPSMKWLGRDIPQEGDIVWVDFLGTSPIIVGIAAPTEDPQQGYIISMTLTNGFSNFGSSFGIGEYWLDSSGWVNLSGVVTRTDAAPPQLITNLPAGYRPAENVYAPVVANNAAARIHIATNGDVTYDSKSTGATLGFLSLDGIRFPAAATYSLTQWQTLDVLSTWAADYTLSSPGIHARDDGLYSCKGQLTGGGAPSSSPPTSVARLPEGARSAWAQIYQLSSNNGSNEVFTQVFKSSTYGKIVYTAGGTASLFLDQMRFWTDRQDNAWTNLTTTGSWVNYGTVYPPAQYLVDKHGMVHMRGVVKSGTLVTTVCTLPVGVRPIVSKMFPAATFATYGRIDVNASGNVIIQVGDNSYFDLSQICFLAEQ